MTKDNSQPVNVDLLAEVGEQRVAAWMQRKDTRRRQRAELAAARRCGLRARHSQRLRHARGESATPVRRSCLDNAPTCCERDHP